MKFNYRFIPGAAVFFGLAGVSLAGDPEPSISSGKQSSSGARWELTGGLGARQAYDLSLGSNRRNLTADEYNYALSSAAARAAVVSEDGEFRLYDDGFVKRNTTFDKTSYWGYDQAGQMRRYSQKWLPSQPWDLEPLEGGPRVGTDSLYFTRSGEIGIERYQRSSDMDTDIYPYLELKRLWENDEKTAERGWVASWSWVPGDGRSTQDLSLIRPTVVDEYYLYGITPPAAPYSGPPLPPGPLLGNAPNDSVLTDNPIGLLGVTRTKAELDLNTLSFGGIWRWLPKEEQEPNRMRFFGADLQAGLSLNFADLRVASSTEVYDGLVPVGTFDEYASERELRAGFYVSLGAIFDLNYHDWFITTQARYDDAGSITARSGQTWATVDLDGWSLMLGLTKRW
jgi:hypothetical protein